MGFCTEITYRTSSVNGTGARPFALDTQGNDATLPAVVIGSTFWHHSDCKAAVAVSVDAPDGSSLWLYIDAEQLRKMGEALREAEAERYVRAERVEIRALV